ncbi:MAG: M18 family aminopeptidase [Cytophagaceae bacterium]|jgi:aspartyl aminopeptidase|nr:M18 family aminopeptidase [Cytophagaceae bacterium]
MENNKNAKELIDFIHQSPSTFHVVENMSVELTQAGFTPLDLRNAWNLKPGGKYFTVRNGSSLFAFIVGDTNPETSGFRIISTHSDSPTFKLKPSPEMMVEKRLLKLNTEVYGAPVLMSWLDRPLSIAGRVSLKGESALYPENRLVNINRPVAIIPNLAIHLNRAVNEGVELNKQKDMLPLLGIVHGDASEGFIIRMAAKELGVDEADILDFDLTLYDFQQGCIMGVGNEFISCPKLDNLASVHAGLKAILKAKPAKATQMLAVFDNEEVGSVTKQGAGSPVLRNLFERILFHLGKTGEALHRAIYSSFMVSADMAHGVHPNLVEKHDPVLHPIINGGPVIKVHAGQKYTTDGDSGAVFETICRKAGVPSQRFANRSDAVGGSTLGNISTGQLDMRCVDVGNPILSMHSVRELSGVDDHNYMIRALSCFYDMDK